MRYTFFKNGPISASFCFYFHSFLVTISIQIEKSVDGVLGIRTWGRRMVSANKTTELWRPPCARLGRLITRYFFSKWMTILHRIIRGSVDATRGISWRIIVLHFSSFKPKLPRAYYFTPPPPFTLNFTQIDHCWPDLGQMCDQTDS